MGGLDDDQPSVLTEGQSGGEHTDAPSYEGDSVPTGLNGSIDESRVGGDHEPPPSVPPLEGKHDAAVTPSVSIATEATAALHSTASDVPAERVVSSIEAAVHADKSASTQAQPAEASSDAMETSEATPAIDEQVQTQLDEPIPAPDAQANGHVDMAVEETQIIDSGPDHPPSPTESTATLVLPSAHDSIAPSDSNGVDGQTRTVESARVPSANRLSIAYAAATRRLVIDASVVDKLKVFRHEARIEVHLTIEKDSKPGQYKGILVSMPRALVL